MNCFGSYDLLHGFGLSDNEVRIDKLVMRFPVQRRTLPRCSLLKNLMNGECEAAERCAVSAAPKQKEVSKSQEKF